MCNTNFKSYGILNVKFHEIKLALKMSKWLTKMPEQATNFSEFVAKKVPLIKQKMTSHYGRST